MWRGLHISKGTLKECTFTQLTCSHNPHTTVLCGNTKLKSRNAAGCDSLEPLSHWMRPTLGTYTGQRALRCRINSGAQRFAQRCVASSTLVQAQNSLRPPHKTCEIFCSDSDAGGTVRQGLREHKVKAATLDTNIGFKTVCIASCGAAQVNGCRQLRTRRR